MEFFINVVFLKEIHHFKKKLLVLYEIDREKERDIFENQKHLTTNPSVPRYLSFDSGQTRWKSTVTDPMLDQMLKQNKAWLNLVERSSVTGQTVKLTPLKIKNISYHCSRFAVKLFI